MQSLLLLGSCGTALSSAENRAHEEQFQFREADRGEEKALPLPPHFCQHPPHQWLPETQPGRAAARRSS